jgi:hypothetical protein
MDAQDILDEITKKQLIWYGHVVRMDPTNEAFPEEPGKMEYTQP